METRITALVPIRHHSQRVQGKNYRALAGKPLFHHIMETLQKVPEIDGIVVDTDSEPVTLGLRAHFPSVMVIRRPEHLRADDVSMNDILMHDVVQAPSDLYLQTHSTNPLLKAATVSSAIRSLRSGYPDHDSLFSVTRRQVRLYDQDGRALNHDPRQLIQTQELPPVYEENSCLYLFTGENLIRRRHRIGENPILFEIGADEAWDIDTELDFAICEFLMARASAA